MQQLQAIKCLAFYDRKGRYVFTGHDLAKVFPGDTPRALQAGLNRLVGHGLLQRAAKGVYVNAMSRYLGGNTLEHIVKAMRRGEYNYVSLESALSEYGAISQIPIDRLTVMTTGRKGEYKTPFGTIELIHTKRPLSDIMVSTVRIDRPLRLASKMAAYRDLKRVGRNVHLVDESELYGEH
jgi:predicted transcriptional regulator of viral defense system